MEVLTDWYPATITPVRPGLYIARSVSLLRDNQYGSMLLYWDGHSWLDSEQRPFILGPDRNFREWRGLAFDPDEADLVCEDVRGDYWSVMVPR